MSGERAIAQLELAAMFVVLFLFLTTGVSVGQYVSMSASLDRIMDRVVYDSGFIPYEIIPASGSPTLTLRSEELSDYIEENIIQRLESELQGLQGGEDQINTFDIEASYVEVEIDPAAGTVSSYEQGEYFSSQLSALKSDIVHAVSNNMENQVDAILAETRTDEFGDQIFTHATPTAMYSLQGQSSRFFPRKIIVSVWVGLDVRDNFWMQMAQKLFQDALLQRTKTIVLRGEASA